MATHPVSVGTSNGGNAFVPKTQPIAVGDEVEWTWADDDHSVTSDTGEWPDSGVHDTGHVFRHTFNTAGKHPYHCSIHGASGGIGMSGVIDVRGRG
jgi:plastocyanin